MVPEAEDIADLGDDACYEYCAYARDGGQGLGEGLRRAFWSGASEKYVLQGEFRVTVAGDERRDFLDTQVRSYSDVNWSSTAADALPN